MKSFKTSLLCFLVYCFVVSFLPFAVPAGEIPHPKSYQPNVTEIEKYKAPFDDPRPYLKTFGPKQILPPELYAKLTYDVEKMKNLWAEVVGFRAPDVVGKIAPEIKPGKYTYKDLEKYSGFKQLMWPDLYNRIKPGGSPFVGSIPEFEIIPTRQYYWALPIAEATKRNLGKAKLDDKGYLIQETWEGGFPFPQPTGKFKAQQIMFNDEKRYMSWGTNFCLVSRIFGINKNFRIDFDGSYIAYGLRFAGRVMMPPFGFLDERAKIRKELSAMVIHFLAPRDVAGTVETCLYYTEDKPDQLMVYVPSLRRVRKLSATDTQDPNMGQDSIYDDNEGFHQKLSPTRYPYKFELVEEREYLVPSPTEDGSEYTSSKEMEFRNIKMERRPIYVVKLTQLDSNYVYSKRIFYIDKEMLQSYHIENYDQKGRLYRTHDMNFGWFPEMGMFSGWGSLILARDHVDKHSTLIQPCQFPAFWNREDVKIEGNIKQK